MRENFEKVMSRIHAACERVNRNVEDVTIIAVTKYVSIERAKEALEVGVSHLGENRLEGFKEKYEEIGNEATWHFIGTLQSRKVKDVISNIDFLHSLDRHSLAKEINKRATDLVPCFVQVNTSGEQSKHGLPVEEVIPFIKGLEQYERIRVAGLMTMAPFTDDEKVVRSCFQKLRELRDEIQQLHLPYAPCTNLSMGMSNDFEIAIEEGATHVRIGTSLVGKESD